VKRLARKSALSLKTQDNAIMVVEDFNFEAPKTKDFMAVLKALGLNDKKSLIVLGGSNNNVYLSSRNLPGSEVITSSELSTYRIMNANNVVLLEGALSGIEENLNK
jgi:large subunit ribosomal protein L4